ncbi:MAG: transposase [Candidatus Microthrix sp.]|nr:transposase [Candidatus Microthrix sp.]
MPLQQCEHLFHRPRIALANAWIESFNSRLRDEFLNGWQFDSLLEVQVLLEDWRIGYKTKRPHTRSGCSPRPNTPASGPPPTNPNSHNNRTLSGDPSGQSAVAASTFPDYSASVFGTAEPNGCLRKHTRRVPSLGGALAQVRNGAFGSSC